MDISHSFVDGMIRYKGFPAPVICDVLTREASRVTYAPGSGLHRARLVKGGARRHRLAHYRQYRRWHVAGGSHAPEPRNPDGRAPGALGL